jgi:hypothetical protein
MSTLMAIENMPLTGANTDLPKLHLTWSCDNDQGVGVVDHAGYIGNIPSTYPIKSHIVFWVANDTNSVRVAPEGRYLDYAESPLISSGLGGKTFSIPLVGYGGTFTGRLVYANSTYEVHDGAVTVGGSTTNLSTITLTAL